jgi:hypothetical protein
MCKSEPGSGGGGPAPHRYDFEENFILLEGQMEVTFPGLPAMRSLLSAENQLGRAARNHVGRRVCPRPRDDLWHHGGVRHA